MIIFFTHNLNLYDNSLCLPFVFYLIYSSLPIVPALSFSLPPPPPPPLFTLELSLSLALSGIMASARFSVWKYLLSVSRSTCNYWQVEKRNHLLIKSPSDAEFNLFRSNIVFFSSSSSSSFFLPVHLEWMLCCHSEIFPSVAHDDRDVSDFFSCSSFMSSQKEEERKWWGGLGSCQIWFTMR